MTPTPSRETVATPLVEEFNKSFAIHDWDCPGDAPVDCGPNDESIAFRERLILLESDARAMADALKAGGYGTEWTHGHDWRDTRDAMNRRASR